MALVYVFGSRNVWVYWHITPRSSFSCFITIGCQTCAWNVCSHHVLCWEDKWKVVFSGWKVISKLYLPHLLFWFKASSLSIHLGVHFQKNYLNDSDFKFFKCFLLNLEISLVLFAAQWLWQWMTKAWQDRNLSKEILCKKSTR